MTSISLSVHAHLSILSSLMCRSCSWDQFVLRGRQTYHHFSLVSEEGLYSLQYKLTAGSYSTLHLLSNLTGTSGCDDYNLKPASQDVVAPAHSDKTHSGNTGLTHLPLMYVEQTHRNTLQEQFTHWLRQLKHEIPSLAGVTHMWVMILCRKTPSTSSMNMLTRSSEPTSSHDPKGPSVRTYRQKERSTTLNLKIATEHSGPFFYYFNSVN